MSVAFDELLDARGLKCPLPILRSRKALDKLPVGGVLKVIATDRGSMPDFQGWAKTAKNMELLEQETMAENGQELYIHYVQRTK